MLHRRCGQTLTKSAPLKQLGLLRQAKWRRDESHEVLVKGLEQIRNIMSENENVKFRTMLVPNNLMNYDFVDHLRVQNVHKVDPKQLYHLVYQSRPFQKGLDITREQEEETDFVSHIFAHPDVLESLILATVATPHKPVPSPSRMILCMDGVIFPSNVGSLFRSAAAIGTVDGIIGTEKTCDFYGWKVIESSKGFGFNIPALRCTSSDEILKIARDNKLLPVVGHATEGIHPNELNFKDYLGAIVIIGNEKHGPSKELLEAAVKVRIPMNSNNMNSLNAGVAGSILLQSVQERMHAN